MKNVVLCRNLSLAMEGTLIQLKCGCRVWDKNEKNVKTMLVPCKVLKYFKGIVAQSPKLQTFDILFDQIV